MRGIDRFVAWVRAGYPAGVPERDYIPLMAVLHRRLGDQEVADLGAELAHKGLLPADHIDVGAGILGRTDEVPSPQEMERVADRLRAAGWDITDDDNS